MRNIRIVIRSYKYWKAFIILAAFFIKNSHWNWFYTAPWAINDHWKLISWFTELKESLIFLKIKSWKAITDIKYINEWKL